MRDGCDFRPGPAQEFESSAGPRCPRGDDALVELLLPTLWRPHRTRARLAGTGMKGWQEQVHALRLGTRPRGSGGASLTTEAATRIAKAGLTSCCSPRIALVQPGALETHGRRDREAARGLEDVAEFLGLARIGQDWFGFIEEVVDVELDLEGAGFLQAPFIGEHGVG